MSLFVNKKSQGNKSNTTIDYSDNDLDDLNTQDNNLNDDLQDDFEPPWLETDNIRYLQENSPEIFEIIMLLKGMTKSKEGKFVKSRLMPQIMSDEGISMVYRTLSSTLIKSISMADLSKDEVQARTLGVINPIILDLAQNARRYNMRPEVLSEIVIMIENLIAAHLSRAINRGEGKLIRGLYNQRENVHTDSSDKKRQGLLQL